MWGRAALRESQSFTRLPKPPDATCQELLVRSTASGAALCARLTLDWLER